MGPSIQISCPRCGAEHAASAGCARPGAERVGEIIGGKYQIVSFLGEGGMGVVYEAKHTFVGRRFAIKFLRPEYARDLDMLARFQREAQAAGALESENIAAVTDFGLDVAGAPYLVMEHLAGDDLARVLARSGRLAASRAAGLTIQACRGLAVAHAHGIVHRDLKPGNLFVLRRADGGDQVKVIDFGIAKLRSAAEDAPSKTKTGATMGTPYYMPPEQARGQRDIDHRADIYALGAILYEMLSGAKPHPGDGYNAILFNILTQPAPALASLRGGLPPGLVGVVERAMAFEPSDRYGSAAELARALQPFAGLPVTPPEELALPLGDSDPRAPTISTPVTGVSGDRAPAAQHGGAILPRGAASAPSRGGAEPAARSAIESPARNRRAPAVLLAGLLAAGAGLLLWRARRTPSDLQTAVAPQIERAVTAEPPGRAPPAPPRDQPLAPVTAAAGIPSTAGDPHDRADLPRHANLTDPANPARSTRPGPEPTGPTNPEPHAARRTRRGLTPGGAPRSRGAAGSGAIEGSIEIDAQNPYNN